MVSVGADSKLKIKSRSLSGFDVPVLSANGREGDIFGGLGVEAKLGF